MNARGPCFPSVCVVEQNSSRSLLATPHCSIACNLLKSFDLGLPLRQTEVAQDVTEARKGCKNLHIMGKILPVRWDFHRITPCE